MANQQRFNLWGMTYLLCTPSSFATVVDANADLYKWLSDAGVKDEDAQKACVAYVGQIKSNTTLYSSIQELRPQLLKTFKELVGSYDGPGCPNGNDSQKIAAAMSEVDPT